MTINTISHQLNRTYHRAIARDLRSNSTLLEEARRVTSAWHYNNPYPVAFVKEWTALLDEPVPSIRNTLVRRDGDAERLRGVSPFALVPSTVWSKTQVKRLWRHVAYHAMRVLEHFEYLLYADHLKRLTRRDRMARFSRNVDDAWIDTFVQGLSADFSTIVFGHFDANLGLDGAVQVSLVDREGVRYADVGVSVDPDARHRGIGYHLLEHGLIWARNHGATRVWSLCAADNVEMQRLGRKKEISTSLLNGSYEASLDAHPLTVGTLALEMLEEFTGEWDCDIKAHKSALSLIAGNGSLHPFKDREFIRLVRLASVGRTDVLTEYIVLFRFALVQYGAEATTVVRMLGELKDTLRPLVTHDPDLHTYVEGLPSRYEVVEFANEVRQTSG